MCEVTNASTTVNVVGSTEGLAVGDRVKGQGIPAGATIATLAAQSFTLSAAASFPSPPYPASYAIQTQLDFEGQMANPGTTGNNTHASVGVDDFVGAETLSLEFEITGVGTTVSWLYQGSEDGADVPDSASDFFALSVLPSDSNTETAAVQTKTAVGVYESSLEIARRPVRKIRLVTSANTGVT